MDSIVERAGKLAGNELKRVRWALGINGVLSIAFAAVILIWPGISLFALAIVFGVFTGMCYPALINGALHQVTGQDSGLASGVQTANDLCRSASASDAIRPRVASTSQR